MLVRSRMRAERARALRRPARPPSDAPVPAWARAADRALAAAGARVRVIASVTPKNYRTELDRITHRWLRGREDKPAFSYEPTDDYSELRRALEALAGELDSEGALGGIYAARARELSDEAAICESRGAGSGAWGAARKRFGRRDCFDDEADALADAWLDSSDEPDESEHRELIRTDDERDPRSLLARIREEIGRHKLPVRVVLTRDMASLAAAGDGLVQIATDRWIGARDVERTTLHEIEGHVLPRTRAAAMPLGIFAVGTAHGADDQEGRALALERAGGWLDARRRKELALRHTATRCVGASASFVETARRLIERRATVPDALRIAARAHRGGGLGREAVYIPALLRVEAAMRDRPELSPVLASGRVSVDAAAVLVGWV